MKWNEILPVLISIVIIILIAVLQKSSRLFAAVTATMPVTIPLALYIVYSSSQGDPVTVKQFTGGLLTGIVPTLAFIITLWLTARAGVKLVPMLVSSYAVWALVLLSLLGIRRAIGL